MKGKVRPLIGQLSGRNSGGGIGSLLASQASRLYGMELEGLSGEDQEFEASRKLVQYLADARRRPPPPRS